LRLAACAATTGSFSGMESFDSGTVSSLDETAHPLEPLYRGGRS